MSSPGGTPTDDDLGKRILDSLDDPMAASEPADQVDASEWQARATLRQVAHEHVAERGSEPPRCAVDGEAWPCTVLRSAAADAGVSSRPA